MAPALGNWYNPEGEGYRPPWAGLSLLDLLEQFRKRVVRSCIAFAPGPLIAFLPLDQIGKPHVSTPVTPITRSPSSS